MQEAASVVEMDIIGFFFELLPPARCHVTLQHGFPLAAVFLASIHVVSSHEIHDVATCTNGYYKKQDWSNYYIIKKPCGVMQF